ncbi:MAG: hypothetical protein JWM25_1695 [Thermoleophilia bacterium]|nr:hypothetical protein [Thermoleophilia bacterium]
MRLRRTWRPAAASRPRTEPDAIAGEVDEDEVLRDTEDSLFAALQESDTGFEALQDTGADVDRTRMRQRLGLLLGAAVLTALWLVAGRRRS